MTQWYEFMVNLGTNTMGTQEGVDTKGEVKGSTTCRHCLDFSLGGEYEYYGKYIKIGEQALFWSTTEYDVTGTSHKFEYAYLWAYRKDSSIGMDNAHKYTAAYIRCIYNN
jgi:uncharacterized protein (TIGR02145 family)